MAKKKKGSPRKGPRAERARREKKARRQVGTEMPFFFRSPMEDIFGTMMSNSTPEQQRADMLLQRAYQAPPGRRREFAEQALQSDPNCVDALVLLSAESLTAEEALQHLRRAEAVGRKALEDYWQDYEGHFWGILETRPYMRARLELAMCLWAARQYDEAITNYEELLRLNPGDNQGVRYLLLPAYLERNLDAKAEKLIADYDEDSAVWEYARLLLSFRASEDSAETKRRLKQALKANKHVPAYLLGDRLLPEEMPPTIGMGDQNEAIDCAQKLLPAWRDTAGMSSWLRGNLSQKSQAGKASEFLAKAHLGDPSNAPPIDQVPQVPGEIWQVDARPLSSWVEEGNQKFRPWLTLIHSRTSELISGSAMSRELPTGEMVCQLLEGAIVAPMMLQPVRPEILEISRADWLVPVRKWAESLGIQVAVQDDLPDIDFLMQDIDNFRERDEPELSVRSLLGIKGYSDERLADFFEAASAFYRQRPWQQIPGDTAIRVDIPALSKNTWYASVMGQSGIEQGLALYDKWEELEALLTGHGDEIRNAKSFSAFSLLFGESLTIHPRDLAALEKHQWPVAGPEAYPCVLRVKKGMKIVAPTAPEMHIMEACLKAIPGFVKNQRQAEHEIEVAGKTVVARMVVVDE